MNAGKAKCGWSNFLKRSFLLTMLAGLYHSCSEENLGPVSPVVGTWEKDFYQLVNLPEDFSSYEGEIFESIFGDEDGYTFTFNMDNTYQRRLSYVGSDSNDDGTWQLEEEILKISSSDSDISAEEFKIEQEITAHEMLLSQILSFYLLPDAVRDTLTTEWADAHPQELAAHFTPVETKVLFLFEK